MKYVFSFLIAVLALPAFADSITRAEIDQLARDIRLEVRNSSASQSDLMEVRGLLDDALTILMGGSSGGGMEPGCIDFAYEKYYISNTSSVAADKASAACRKIEDVGVARFLYEKYYTSNTASVAMDKAAEKSGAGARGKLEIIKFAFEKYYSSNTSTVAADKAATQAAIVHRNSFDCVKSMFEKHYSSNTSTVAMDKAFQSCAN